MAEPETIPQIARLAQTLRLTYGGRLNQVSDEALIKFVAEGLAAASQGGVEQEDDVLRFIGLPFAMPAEQQQSLFIKQAALYALAN